MANPLITLAVTAYNHQRYIAEAIAGALAQNYEPLEIVISDDCSSDRTYTIAEELVLRYSGPHSVQLRRTARNLGIGRHISELMALSKGEIVVFAAGDDVSHPDRVTELARAWAQHAEHPCWLVSDYIEIDETGKVISDKGERVATHNASVSAVRLEDVILRQRCHLGCSQAIDKKLWALYGPLPRRVFFEDLAMAFRAALLGKIVYVDAPLIDYRVHGANNSAQRFKSGNWNEYKDSEWRRQRNDLHKYHSIVCMYRDLKTARGLGLVDVVLFSDLARMIERAFGVFYGLSRLDRLSLPERFDLIRRAKAAEMSSYASHVRNRLMPARVRYLMNRLVLGK
jgi:glycosyltransferase involved in cell wall biosynthesis